MQAVIAVIAAGSMGSAVGRRLHEHGARVLTSVEGRRPETAERARAADMIPVGDDEIAQADIILSIVPPAEAVALAVRLAAPIAKSARKPIFVDCNAVDVRTVEKVAEAVGSSGARFVDGAIIGLPPAPEKAGPRFYFSGKAAPDLQLLGALGLEVRIMEGPAGAASSLKMSYAGINKGLTAIAAAMVLAATRAGAAAALHEELAASLPQLLNRFSVSLPDMYPKAYRWVAEMHEIAAFLEDDEAAGAMFEGAAKIYDRLAQDYGGARTKIDQINAFLAKQAPL